MTNTRLPLVIALAALVWLAGCASFTGPSQQDRREAADRVLKAYEIPAMLEQVAPVINDSLKANLPSSVSDAERERLARAVAEAYASEPLLADMNRALRRRARSDDQVGVLLEARAVLDKKLTKDMIALERKAGTDEFDAGFEQFLKQPIEEEDKPRLDKARRLLDNMGLVELQLTFNVGMLKGMIAARNAAAGSAAQTSSDTASSMAERTRNSLRKRMNQKLPIMLFYAYRNVPDAKLDRYAKLHASSPLAWLNEATPEVLESVLQQATRDLVTTYGDQPDEGA